MVGQKDEEVVDDYIRRSVMGIQFGRKDYRASQPESRDGNAERECVQEGECRPRHASKKSTAKWCKGKVGREHQWEWIATSKLPNATRSREMTPERLAAHLKEYGLGCCDEVQWCTACQKQSYERRYVCHCGEVMVAKPGESSWWRQHVCPECGYDNSGRNRSGYWQWADRGHTKKVWIDTTPPRVPCQCEVLAAKLEKQRRK
jgi:hypothetical protein